MEAQFAELAANPDIIVATPGAGSFGQTRYALRVLSSSQLESCIFSTSTLLSSLLYAPCHALRDIAVGLLQCSHLWLYLVHVQLAPWSHGTT